jgi:hypothetical protein
MWLFPKDPWRVHFRLKTNRGWNIGADFSIPSKYRKWNRNIKISSRVRQVGRNISVKHYINRRYVSRSLIRNQTLIPLPNRNLYIKHFGGSRLPFRVRYVRLTAR